MLFWKIFLVFILVDISIDITFILYWLIYKIKLNNNSNRIHKAYRDKIKEHFDMEMMLLRGEDFYDNPNDCTSSTNT